MIQDTLPTRQDCSGQVVDENGNLLAVQRAFVNPAASQTDAQVVAGVSGFMVRVLAIFALAGGTATTLTFNSKGSGAGTAISPLLANGVNGAALLPYCPHGWFETTAGQALTVTTGAGAATGILVLYVLAPAGDN